MKILVAYDGSNGARAALAAATEIALASNAHLIVTHALNPKVAAASVWAQTSAEALEIAIRGARANIREQMLFSPGLDGEVLIEELERGEDVADGLVRVAESREADFIAIASSRAGTVQGALLGSVAAAVMRKSQRPVIVAHPDSNQHPAATPWPLD